MYRPDVWPNGSRLSLRSAGTTAESFVDSPPHRDDHPAKSRLKDGPDRRMSMNIQAKKKPQVAIMNAVHDLPVLVARDEGFFKDEGLDIEFVTTPGMAQVSTTHLVKFDSVFDRPLDSVYNEGGIDQYRMCEWGIMKRAVEANSQHLRGRKIVALGASMSKFAIVVSPKSDIYEPEMLKDKPIATTPNNGSDFTTLKMMEGFLAPEHIKRVHAGSMLKRLEAVRDGEVAAASLMEPWISVAQKWGMRILIESHSTRSEAAGDDLDGKTLAAMFRAQARAVKEIEKDPTRYIHYFIAETGGLLEPHEFQSWRLLHAAPQPYTRERFDDTYNWTVKWNMTVPGATYETVVDNRAWEWK
jgi:NitT/TauT family transport system substrate-binding protein